MHIFIMLITSVQSFILIACKPWEELITQTCYPMLKANLKIALSRKCGNFVKNYFFISKNSYAHLQYTHNKSRKENPQKLTQLSSRSHPRHLVGKRTAQKDTIIDITSDSQVNSNFPYRWSPASLTFNNYFYLFLYLYIT